MSKERELEHKFWKAVKADRTMMLGVDGVEDGHAQPMTALLDPEERHHGPIWFFTSKDNGLVRAMQTSSRAMAHFVSKDHDLSATLHGNLVADNDPEQIERLWNPFVAAWFEGGKSDPKLQLIRLDAESAQIWLNENSLFAGIKLLFGADPKEDYKDKVATVSLD